METETETQTPNKKGIYYNDQHFWDISLLADHLHDNEELDDMEENGILVEETDLEPLCQIDEYFIADNIDEDRLSEYGDELDKVRQLVKKHCNFTALNAAMPKLYYPNGVKYEITKKELLDCL